MNITKYNHVNMTASQHTVKTKKKTHKSTYSVTFTFLNFQSRYIINMQLENPNEITKNLLFFNSNFRQRITFNDSSDKKSRMDAVLCHEAVVSNQNGSSPCVNGINNVPLQQQISTCCVHRTSISCSSGSQQQVLQEKNGSPFTQTKNGESLDIMFQNITYTVNLGWGRGKFSIYFFLFGRAFEM